MTEKYTSPLRRQGPLATLRKADNGPCLRGGDGNSHD